MSFLCDYNLGKHIGKTNRADGTTQSSANASGNVILMDLQRTFLERNHGCPNALRETAGAAHERSRLGTFDARVHRRRRLTE
jgi:hypothetical protein